MAGSIFHCCRANTTGLSCRQANACGSNLFTRMSVTVSSTWSLPVPACAAPVPAPGLRNLLPAVVLHVRPQQQCTPQQQQQCLGSQQAIAKAACMAGMACWLHCRQHLWQSCTHWHAVTAGGCSSCCSRGGGSSGNSGSGPRCQSAAAAGGSAVTAQGAPVAAAGELVPRFGTSVDTG